MFVARLRSSNPVKPISLVYASERSRYDVTVSPRFIMGGSFIFSSSLSSMVSMQIAFMALMKMTIKAKGKLN
jgi:hypothetical protein